MYIYIFMAPLGQPHVKSIWAVKCLFYVKINYPHVVSLLYFHSYSDFILLHLLVARVAHAQVYIRHITGEWEPSASERAQKA